MNRLILPALRAHMGDWIYYLATVKISELATRVSIASEIHESRTLSDYIQRQLDESTHAAKIAEYLLSQPQRLFDALVIGVYGGDPQWYELDIANNEAVLENGLPEELDGVLGILILNGSEKLFAIDGQHRLVGMRKALTEKTNIGEEEVGVMFVGHKRNKEGRERTRRLFTTLNRYAKPVGKFNIIALDEDDVIAIVTRDLIDQHPLFLDKTSLAKGKSIPVSDHRSLTSIITLYDSLDVYLRDRFRGWKDYKRIRPSDESIANFYTRSGTLWDCMQKYFVEIDRFQKSKPDDEIAAEYRRRDGGHLLFRPVGFQMIIKVIRYLMDANFSLDESVKKLSMLPLELSQPPWKGLLWNATKQRMITAAENQRAATQLLYYAAKGDVERFKSTPKELRAELAGLLNRDADSIDLEIQLSK